MEEKISSSALESMEKYKDMKITLGQLDATMYDDWLAYSNILMQVCSEMDFDGSSDESSDGDQDDGGTRRIAPFKKMSAKQPTGARTLSREQIIAIQGYAAGNNLQFSDVSLETVEKSEGGVTFWAAKTREAVAGQLQRNPAEKNMPLAIKAATSKHAEGNDRPAQHFPMLRNRTYNTKGAEDFGHRIMNF